MYTAFKQKKEDCLAQVETAQCNYDEPEQISLRALYPLSWLRYQGSFYFANQPSMARRLLNQAIDGFTESTLVIVAPELIRENLLGCAFCERELGKFDKPEYEKAIADFKQIMKDGACTRQYRAAQQGLATTYAAMGRMDEAARLSGQLAEGAYGSQREGMEMLRLQDLLKAEAATNDPEKRADFHREALEFMRGKQGDRDSWAIVLAAVARNVRDPIAELAARTIRSRTGCSPTSSIRRRSSPRPPSITSRRRAADIPRPTNSPPIFITPRAATSRSRSWLTRSPASRAIPTRSGRPTCASSSPTISGSKAAARILSSRSDA